MPSRELHEAFNFTVTVEGFPDEFHFAQCTDLQVSTPVVAFREAGSLFAVHDPGQPDYAPVTLSRGASRSRALHDWMLTAILAGAYARYYPGYRREIQILQRGRRLNSTGRSKEILQVYTLHRAFPSSYIAGGWDNSADAVVIQAMQLNYDYFSLKVRKTADSRLATAR